MALVAVALAAGAGCGGGDQDQPSEPLIGQSPEDVPPDPPAPELAGEVLVIDLAGKPQARPAKLDVASDGTMRDLGKWTGWGSDEARAEGTFALNGCRPTCAEGEVGKIPSRIELSDIIECDGDRYYSTAAIIPQSGINRGAPAAFVETPC